MQFANAPYLWLFLIFIPLIAWYVYKQRRDHASLAMSTLAPFAKTKPSLRARMRHILFVLRLAALGCLIIVLARPLLPEDQRNSHTKSTTEGTDIVLAIDVSTSMLARDFDPDRLEAAKRVATTFINGRPDDNIGLVVFAGESMTALPLTNDHEALTNYIASIKTEMLEDGTAIGDGIGTAINAIANGEAKSKSIIILTDGVNNTGLLTPRDAGLLAKEKNIKVYTIGIGKHGKADFPVPDQFGRMTYQKIDVVIDEDILKDISKETNGKYFRATDSRVLADIFTEIDQLEKTQMNVEYFSHAEDDPGVWPWLALAFFVLELILRYTVFRTGP